MEKEFYTELIFRQKDPDEFGPREITVKETTWDVNIDQVVEMFHTICIGATFMEGAFRVGLKHYLEEHGYTVIDPNEKENEEE